MLVTKINTHFGPNPIETISNLVRRVSIYPDPVQAVVKAILLITIVLLSRCPIIMLLTMANDVRNFGVPKTASAKLVPSYMYRCQLDARGEA
jgi:hypothetical protein